MVEEGFRFYVRSESFVDSFSGEGGESSLRRFTSSDSIVGRPERASAASFFSPLMYNRKTPYSLKVRR